jgi:hypothetical protein
MVLYKLKDIINTIGFTKNKPLENEGPLPKLTVYEIVLSFCKNTYQKTNNVPNALNFNSESSFFLHSLQIAKHQ